MIQLGWIYAFNIIINTFFSFITVTILIRALMVLLRVKQPRLKAFMLGIPLFKVILDLFLYDFSHWALAYAINPCGVVPGSRTFLFSLEWVPGLRVIPVTFIQLVLSDGKTFTPADLIALSIGHWWVKGIVLVTLALSLFFFTRWLYQVIQSTRFISNLLNHSYKCPRTLTNPLLSHAIQTTKTQIRVSSLLTVPCCVGIFSRSILIPQTLVYTITQAEFEAVVAHELGHLTWQDAALRMLFEAIASFFWWLPLKRTIGHVENAQEIACDTTVETFALSPIDLADALIKVARYAKRQNPLLLLPSFFQQERMKGRIAALLNEKAYRPPSALQVLHMISIGSVMVIVALGRFWIF